jgi:hypothetical protein
MYHARSLVEAMSNFKKGTLGAVRTLAEQHKFDLGELCALIRANLSPLDRARVGNAVVSGAVCMRGPGLGLPVAIFFLKRGGGKTSGERDPFGR